MSGWAGRALAGVLLAAGLMVPSATQNAVANGDTRTLTLHHAHTQENITITFRRDGAYDRSALEKLNWFLRDWRNDDTTQMDPRLFDVVWATWREVGSSSAIRIVSAYRSPGTNAMLRRRSSGVAKNSQHIQGKAMDLHMPDVSMAKVREIGMRLQRGGVGYYPTAGTPFVHLDVGSVRSWPRMPRNQLERLFPDGKTVHIPADGTPLAGYEAALAEVQSRGGSALSYADITSPRRSLWAALFGGEDEEVDVPVRRGRAPPAQAQRGRQVAALSAPPGAGNSGGDNASVYAITQPAAPEPAVAPAPAGRPVAAPKPKPLDAEPSKVAVASAPEPKPEATPPRLAATPLPPRRPSDILTEAVVASRAPLPPIRPSLLASAEPPQAITQAAAPAAEPPAKAVTMPLPPARPAALALAEAVRPAAGLPAAITGGTDAASQPTSVAALTPAKVPMPPARPVLTGSSPRPEPDTPVARAPAPAASSPAKTTRYAIGMDSEALSSLMAAVAADSAPIRRPKKVELPEVRESLDSEIVAGRFGKPQEGPVEKGFSGGLTRPMTAGFVAR
jgi:uncharacterized protein YcbK (DUF882 family)